MCAMRCERKPICRTNKDDGQVWPANVDDIAEFQSLLSPILQIDNHGIEEWHVFKMMPRFGQGGSPLDMNS